MKHVLLVLLFALGLASLPATSFAKDKRDDGSKSGKDVKNQLDGVKKRYEIYRDRVKLNGDRRMWQQLQDVRTDIDRISSQVDSGDYDSRDIRYRIQRADDNLRAIQSQLDYKNSGPSRPQGGFYRPPY